MQEKREFFIKIKSFIFLKKSTAEILLPGIYTLVLAAYFVLPTCSRIPKESSTTMIQPQPLEQKIEQVNIKPDDYNTGLIYSIQKDNCTIEWITRNNEVGIIKNWSHCPASLSEQLPLMTELCASFLSKDKNASSLRALFWGRLLPDEMPGPPELSMRLALAAHKSPDWDSLKGKAKNGYDYELARELANNEMIYPELKELFERFNKKIRITYFEKLCIMKAKDLPYFDQLKQYGVKADEKLPFDAMTWFSIKDAQQK